jgi:hypothetical protein
MWWTPDGERILQGAEATLFREALGIDEDYFIAVPPDPTDEEMKGVWATLRGLTQGGS